MALLFIDIETYSSVSLEDCGVYKYTESPDFDILLLSYSLNGNDVQTYDLASGERLNDKVVKAILDDRFTKLAFNAAFERVGLSRYLKKHYTDQCTINGEFLDPEQWV